MAALPENNTNRLFFDYSTGVSATSRAHTISWRYAAGQPTDSVQSAFLTFLNAVTAAGVRQGWRVTGVRQQTAGTLFSVPITPLPALLLFVGTGDTPYNARLEAVEETMQGRSLATGRRVDFSLYRAIVDADGNFRIGLPASWQSALSTASGAGNLLAIDGAEPIWYTYLNQNYNSYWETRSRTT